MFEAPSPARSRPCLQARFPNKRNCRSTHIDCLLHRVHRVDNRQVLERLCRLVLSSDKDRRADSNG